MRRYVERTAKFKAYTEQHRAHMADPRVVNGFRPLTKEIIYQIVVERSQAARTCGTSTATSTSTCSTASA